MVNLVKVHYGVKRTVLNERAIYLSTIETGNCERVETKNSMTKVVFNAMMQKTNVITSIHTRSLLFDLYINRAYFPLVKWLQA